MTELLPYSLLALILVSASLGLLIAYILHNPVLEGIDYLRKIETTDVGNSGPVFLFDGQTLVDCNAAGRTFLAQSAVLGTDWQKLHGFLRAQFSDIDSKLGNLMTDGAFAETSHMPTGGAVLLEAEYSENLIKISLTDPDIAEGPGITLAVAFGAMKEEVHLLRRLLSVAPVLIWRENAEGQITWANSAFLLTAADSLPLGQELSWPLPRLFDRIAVEQSADRQRHSLLLRGRGTVWFDLVSQISDDGILCYATPADAAVLAENALQEFMQTLSKTFAQLPIGLAIFDRNRKLQVFNPALLDLTMLPVDFVSMRPSLSSVLDAMRDRNLLPEPKDYHNWRRQILDLEKDAASGLYQENWTLPDGQTFRVTGRPHPNGALALLIEDISNEMQRARRYRADLEISQAIIDQFEDSLVVFGQDGHLIWSNQAYIRTWSDGLQEKDAGPTVEREAQHWKTLVAPTQFWSEVDDFIHTVGNREKWQAELRLLDGRLVHCRVVPIALGATMISLSIGSVPQAIYETEIKAKNG